MEELLDASKLLRASLDRYISACSSFTASYNPDNERDPSYPPLKCIRSELKAAASYEKDIRDAKAMLTRSRNRSPTLVPINVLPSDVLEWIFQLVYHSWLCTSGFERVNADGDEYDEEPHSHYTRHSMDVKIPSPMLPEALTHVCAHWRRVALSSHKLWHRIDLPIFGRSYKWLLRGQAFASRVAPPRLDVHILMTDDDLPDSEWIYNQVDSFCTSVGSKIQSLQITNGVEAGFSTFSSKISPLLNASLAHLEPEILGHLAIIDHSPVRYGLRITAEFPQGTWFSDSIPIDVPSYQMDNILHPIKSLWLKNHFFPWESPAYCGLIDLRLLTSGRHTSISFSSSQLISILSSCPNLRTFHCDIGPEEMDVDQLSTTGSVYLAELEDLNIRQIKSEHHEYFFPLILPGPKPLRLSIRSAPHTPFVHVLFSTALATFLNRSNVTSLHIQGDYGRLPFERLLVDLPASVRMLGLRRFNLDREMTIPVQAGRSRLAWLDCLKLQDCNFQTSKLQEINDASPIRVLKLDVHGCRADGFHEVMDETMDRLLDIFPKVERIDSLVPIEEWDSWGVGLD